MCIRAIRGAITIENNVESEVLDQASKLIKQIISKNSLKIEDIISIIFTVTDDLNAVYPAAAVRKMGIVDVPLMCVQEMKVPGSLEKCLRVMLHISTDRNKSEIEHVYLEGATVLRPDLVK